MGVLWFPTQEDRNAVPKMTQKTQPKEVSWHRSPNSPDPTRTEPGQLRMGIQVPAMKIPPGLGPESH